MARLKRRGRGCLLWLGGLLAAILVVLLLGAIYEGSAEAADVRAYPAPGELVDVGGYRLHLNCVGTGSPTVVIEAGLGDWSATWSSWVQPAVAESTRVCTYDRAGAGWSDAGPLPRTADTFARELHTLLQNARAPGPFVLVGHSSGGLTVRLFAHAYPADVAGIVLVDSMSPREAKLSASAAPPQTSTSASDLSIATLPARLGLLRLLAWPLQLKAGLAPKVADAYVAFAVTPRSVQTLLDESIGLGTGLMQAGEVTSFGTTPLIVVSRGRDLDPDWQAMQAELLLLSSESQQVIADKSGHNVQLDQPESAAGAIVRMVERVHR